MIIIILFIIVLIIGTVGYSLYKIMYTEHISDEDVYGNEKRMEKYGIKERTTPESYGLKYKECEFYSNKKKLSAWYISGTNKLSDKAIIMVHGRGTNRLILLEYLKLLKQKQYTKDYSILLVNMRNAGNSDKGLTKLGVAYAEDIFASLTFLRNNFNKRNFILYGFSMGALGSAIAVCKYRKKFENMGIKIKKLILDSPLSNSKKMILKATGENFYTFYFKIIAPLAFNFVVKGKLNKLKLGYLLQNIKIETLILQSVVDETTPYEILKKELKELKGKSNIFLHLFSKGKHVLLYRENSEEYMETVDIFMKN